MRGKVPRVLPLMRISVTSGTADIPARVQSRMGRVGRTEGGRQKRPELGGAAIAGDPAIEYGQRSK